MTQPSPPGPPHVALIIPVYNEVDVLPFLLEELAAFRASRPERVSLLFVDDGSTDGTAARIRELAGPTADISVLSFSRNFGHQVAVTAGLDFCDADAVIVMDADLQDPPEVAGRMIDAWQAGADVVYGKRLEREQVGFLQRITARLYYRFFRSFTGVDAPLDTGDFRLISRPVVEAFRRLPEQQPYVRGLISWLGFRQEAVEYVRPGRKAGVTKYPWRRRFDLALDGLASFSGKPLRYAMRLGLLVSAGSMLGLIWVLLTKYVFQTAITGWASLIFAAFFFGGMQLFFLGVIGSYLARVYDEVKGRPRYVVRSSWSSGPVGNNFVGSTQADGP